jgi:hypothetical protein
MGRKVGYSAGAMLFLSLASLVGCGKSGPPMHPVKGTVEVNGKPGEHAIVFMHRVGRDPLVDPLPYGTCIADGSFEIETPNVGKGAVEGEYKITVFLPDMTKPEDGNGQRPDALNGAYEKVAESSPTAKVKSGVNELGTYKLIPGPPKARVPVDKNIK